MSQKSTLNGNAYIEGKKECAAVTHALREFRSEFADIELEIARRRRRIRRLKEQADASSFPDSLLFLNQRTAQLQQLRLAAARFVHLFYWINQLEILEKRRLRNVPYRVRRFDERTEVGRSRA